ncbi:MAG: hypothetical protein K2N48_11460 [Muribaculaceae bacterium]|nr:hypothetical protein [Muribaculaceae bacterium]
MISSGGGNCVKRLSNEVWKEITVKNICKSPDAKFADLKQMADYYRNNMMQPTEDWLKSLTDNQPKDLWITNFICGEANISREPENGKFCKNLHQRRRTAKLVKEARALLEAEDFGKYHTFREILEKTIDMTKDLKGFGSLCCYDFSLRYGFNRDILPKEVYIHAGTSIGLECLEYIWPSIEIKKDKKFGSMIEDLSTLPKEIADLGALHIENFLCVFHDHLLRYENYLRGLAGDKGPNYGVYKNVKNKNGTRELKDESMRRQLDEIYRLAKKKA